MTAPGSGDLQRWSEELARNPASLAFLPLARAYRRQGRLDLAMRLCRRGLEQHPSHVEAHALLALLFLETGDRARAAQEWSAVLRLRPGNFEALRGMGFRYLEQGEILKARHHLERAALIRPADTAVQEALRLLRAYSDDDGGTIRTSPAEPTAGAVGSGNGRAVPSAAGTNPFSLAEPEDGELVLELTDVAEEPEIGVPPAFSEPDAREPVPVAVGSAVAERAPDRGGLAPGGAVHLASDPTRLFDTMLFGGPVLGALLLDTRGLVLAGRLAGDAAAQADEVGALIGGTVEDVARAAVHLELRAWRGMLMECHDALIQVSSVHGEALLVLAVRRDTPRGWVSRAAIHAAALVEPFLRSSV